jgi:hypothetical protein
VKNMIDINAIKNLDLSLNFGKSGKVGDGGGGGSILIFAEEISGNGHISVDGGNGMKGGPAGNIKIIATKNKFNGAISAQGGDSYCSNK